MSLVLDAQAHAPRRSTLAQVYDLTADGCATAMASTPALEGPALAVIRTLWSTYAIGRFCRSVGYRFLDRLRARGTPSRAVVACGVPLRVDVTDWVFSGLFLANVPYEHATSAYLREHLRPGDVLVDVGANSGYFSLLAAHLVGPRGRVIAFEPNPEVRRSLDTNIQLNRFGDRVEVVDYAICDRSAEAVRFFVTPHSGFSTLSPDASHGGGYLAGGRDISVATRTLDGWMSEAGIARIDLLKIDVEGGEYEVVAGAAGALAQGRIRRVVCETALDSPAHRALRSYGYQPAVLERVGPVVNIAYARPVAHAEA